MGSSENFQLVHRTRAWLKNMAWEGAAVMGAGIVFALLLNAVSSRGLSLTRNYFPGDTGVRGPSRQTNPAATNNVTGLSSTISLEEATVKRLKEKGLRALPFDEVLALFRDPRYEQQLVVFIDARNDEQYQKGHIPGAFLFDHYRPDRYLPVILPVCQTAESIVVYCHGGDCEDSEFAATQLRELDIPAEKLVIYLGGFTDWSNRNAPVELGAQRSGEFQVPAP